MTSSRTLRHGLRTAYLAVGALSVAAATAGRRGDRLTRIVKPALMPLLAASVAVGGRRNESSNRRALRNSDTSSSSRVLLLAGLAGGGIGDCILMGSDGRSSDLATRAKNLNYGSAAFATNQMSYIANLWRQGRRPGIRTIALRVPVLAVGIATAAMRAPGALPAAVGYGSLLAMTSTLAADEGESTRLGIGGSLFVVSDGLILARQAYLMKESPAIRAVDGVVDGLVMATYVAAQFLLVNGLTDGLEEN